MVHIEKLMKQKVFKYKKAGYIILLFTVCVSGGACSDRLDWLPDPAPEVKEIFPLAGSEGTEVTITGDHFSSHATQIRVAFNGQPATIIKAAGKKLIVEAPDSTTGPIAVMVNGQTSTTQPVFEYQ